MATATVQGKQRIILDCDPGVDDAVAILLALASPEIEVLGITTVAGNVPLAKTEYNARRVCTLAGRRDMSVFAGCSRPMSEAAGRHTTVHGRDGLGGVELPEPDFSLEARHGVDFIIQAVAQSPGEITLCPIGPMTNIALALIKQPSIARQIKRIVFMGGAAFCPGNVTPVAEFNLYFDPWAAQVVIESGIPLVMFGLDVTQQACVTPAFLNALQHAGPLQATVAAMLRGYGVADPCLHDPCVIAWLIDPTLFQSVPGRVSMSQGDEATRGQTVVASQQRHLVSAPVNCQVMVGVDNPRLLKLLADRLGGGD